MSIVEIQPKPSLSVFPAMGSPRYNYEAFDWGTQFPLTATWIAATAEATKQNAQDALGSAQAAGQAAAHAAEVQQILMGATNFKGLWQDLIGALQKPATVKHEGRFWLLLTNLTNVTAAEPGVSPAWTSLDAGVRPQQNVSSGVVDAIVGVLYVIDGPTVRLNAPATGMQQGDHFGFRLAAPVSRNQVVNFAGVPVCDRTLGEVYIDRPAFALDLEFNISKGMWV